MKTASKMAAQGDVAFIRVAKLPDGLVEVPRDNGRLIVTHSETGHHHAIDSMHARMFADPKDPLVCYLVNECDAVDVVHHRSWDTHETVRLLGEHGAVWQVRRQREWTPEGWRRVLD
jgi:hypothetical protein